MVLNYTTVEVEVEREAILFLQKTKPRVWLSGDNQAYTDHTHPLSLHFVKSGTMESTEGRLLFR